MALCARNPRFPLPYICTIRVNLKHFAKQGNISSHQTPQTGFRNALSDFTLCTVLFADVTITTVFVRCYNYQNFWLMLQLLQFLADITIYKLFPKVFRSYYTFYSFYRTQVYLASDLLGISRQCSKARETNWWSILEAGNAWQFN